ncbi:S8 family serine peptidase [Oculatella sp. FACHB-28]|uniref:S8 family serine peptidase n=1 Tax=Oculatella sp. FACHB-28 TaxID=2692845 RepID=UPI0016832215|nr:S8 family serine peptidase [Oculatella sp. FACHB-28]MBD2054550.1 S8 family serine peptidase [Oculatella sp. FACHB-28]
MSINEINPGNGLETGVDPSTGLPGSTDINRDPFRQSPSRAHSTLINISTHPLLNPADGLDIGASHDSSINAAQTKSGTGTSSVYGDEFESGIPPIDFAARQVGKAFNVVDKTIEESTSGLRQFISETATHLPEAAHEGIDTVRETWNAPDNELREGLTGRLQQGIGFFKKWVANLSENRDVREFVDSAITVGRNLAEKTGDVIQNAQVATESWVNGAYSETYLENFLPSGQSGGGDRLAHPYVGVIDTGFKAQDHGTQVIDVIQRVGHQFPDWLADSVGTGTWSKSLVNFVDAAKARGHSNAVINLSFDLTQINPDGSVSTRLELTAEEREALKYAQANRVLVVASAGNQGEAMSALGQASQEFDNVIAVGASEGGKRAEYSSYGAGLDFVAAGQGGEAMGTSLAAARVTGAIAKTWDANPQLDYRQVVQALESTAIDLQQPGRDSETGYGQVNISAAIDLAEDLTPQPRSLSTQVLPTIKRGQAEDLHNAIVERDSLIGQKSNSATPSERPNLLLVEGTGTQPEPRPSYEPHDLPRNPDAAEVWVTPPDQKDELLEQRNQIFAEAAEHTSSASELSTPKAPGLDKPPVLLKYEQGVPLTSDPAVKQWQQRMKDQGYAPNIAIDGFYGPESEQVARKFQEAQGLEVDGVVGPDTWNAAFSNDVSEPPPLQPVSIAAIDHADVVAAPPPAEPNPQHEPHDVPTNPDAAEVWLTPPDQKDELLERRANIFSGAELRYQPSDLPKNPDAAEIWLANPEEKRELLERRSNSFSTLAESNQTSAQTIAEMSHIARMGEAAERSLPMLGAEVEATFRELVDPANLPQLLTEFVGEALLMYTGLGLLTKIEDAYQIGSALWDAGGYIRDFYAVTENAGTEADLNTAAQHLTDAISTVGVDTIAELLLGRAVGRGATDGTSISNQPSSSLDSDNSPPSTNRNDDPTGTTNSGTTIGQSREQNTNNSPFDTNRPNDFENIRGLNDENRTSLYRLGDTSNFRDLGSGINDNNVPKSPTSPPLATGGSGRSGNNNNRLPPVGGSDGRGSSDDESSDDGALPSNQNPDNSNPPPNPEAIVSLSPEPRSNIPAIEPSHNSDPVTSSSTPPRSSDAASAELTLEEIAKVQEFFGDIPSARLQEVRDSVRAYLDDQGDASTQDPEEEVVKGAFNERQEEVRESVLNENGMELVPTGEAEPGEPAQPERLARGNYADEHGERFTKLPPDLDDQRSIRVNGRTSRMDRVDWRNGVIYEIKSETDSKNHYEQINRYVEAMNLLYPRSDGASWRGEIVTYNPKEVTNDMLERGHLPGSVATRILNGG